MTELTAPDVMTTEQQQRVGALRVASEVLRASTGRNVLSTGGTIALPKHRTPQDLIDLAGWIVTGVDPLDKYTPEGGNA